MKYPQYYKTIDRLIYAHKMENAIKKADCIIATSKQTQRDIESIIGTRTKRIEVIYQDCDPKFYTRLSQIELEKVIARFKLPTKYLLLVSKFEQRKNHIQVLQAMVSMNETTFPLVMVGRPGNTANEVKQFIEKHNLSDDVIVIHDATQDDLVALYQSAYASIFPSEYEGFGIPVLESLACGTPVLTSKDSCMEEIAESAGLYFDPQDSKDIAKCIKSIKDQTVISQLSSNISERLTKFNNTQLLHQHTQLYESLAC